MATPSRTPSSSAASSAISTLTRFLIRTQSRYHLPPGISHPSQLLKPGSPLFPPTTNVKGRGGKKSKSGSGSGGGLEKLKWKENAPERRDLEMNPFMPRPSKHVPLKYSPSFYPISTFALPTTNTTTTTTSGGSSPNIDSEAGAGANGAVGGTATNVGVEGGGDKKAEETSADHPSSANSTGATIASNSSPSPSSSNQPFSLSLFFPSSPSSTKSSSKPPQQKQSTTTLIRPPIPTFNDPSYKPNLIQPLISLRTQRDLYKACLTSGLPRISQDPHVILPLTLWERKSLGRREVREKKGDEKRERRKKKMEAAGGKGKEVGDKKKKKVAKVGKSDGKVLKEEVEEEEYVGKPNIEEEKVEMKDSGSKPTTSPSRDHPPHLSNSFPSSSSSSPSPSQSELSHPQQQQQLNRQPNNPLANPVPWNAHLSSQISRSNWVPKGPYAAPGGKSYSIPEPSSSSNGSSSSQSPSTPTTTNTTPEQQHVQQQQSSSSSSGMINSVIFKGAKHERNALRREKEREQMRVRALSRMDTERTRRWKRKEVRTGRGGEVNWHVPLPSTLLLQKRRQREYRALKANRYQERMTLKKQQVREAIQNPKKVQAREAKVGGVGIKGSGKLPGGGNVPGFSVGGGNNKKKGGGRRMRGKTGGKWKLPF